MTTEQHGSKTEGRGPLPWESLCLSDDPFAGDYGGAGESDRVLSDKMVTNRKGGTCHACNDLCKPGTRNRVRVEVYDDELMRFRWCQECCFGMAVYDHQPDILENRIAQGIVSREASDD